MFEPVEQVASEYDIERRENYIHSRVPDTTNHGGDVFELLRYFAPDASFNLYRIIADGRDASRGNFIQAIADASRHGVDILNLSVGVYHSEEPDGSCGGHCRVADETRLAIQDGLTVVSATGNREDEDSLAVHCPALASETIGVGGFVARCRQEPIESAESGQYWVRNEGMQGPFCGQRGCGPTSQCREYRYEYPWRGNVSFHNATPDVLAPVHHPAGTVAAPVLQGGTSFGTPIVSGVLAAVVSDIGDDIPPKELQRAVGLGGVDIDEGQLPKFTGRGTRAVLRSERG